MNCEYIQDLRFKLQKRIGNLNLVNNPELFHFALQQLWDFITNDPTLASISEDLACRFPTMQEEAQVLTSPKCWSNALENAAFCYFVVKACAESENPMIEFNIAMVYPVGGTAAEPYVRFFRSNFIQPFFVYLDEHLSDQNFVFKLMLHYKQKCELFKREDLFKQWCVAHTHRKGEKVLKKHLFEYLHDQGFGILEEPKSASGEIDLIATFTGDQKVFIEAKVLYECGSRGKKHILNGFKQAYLYFEDHLSPVGYLIVFKACENDLNLSLADNGDDRPFINYNQIAIYIVVIDIFPHELPASARGRLKPIQITRNDFVQIVKQ